MCQNPSVFDAFRSLPYDEWERSGAWRFSRKRVRGKRDATYLIGITNSVRCAFICGFGSIDFEVGKFLTWNPGVESTLCGLDAIGGLCDCAASQIVMV